MKKTIKTLIEKGLAFPAMLPEKNDTLLSEKGKIKREKIIKDPEEIKKFHELSISEKQKFLNFGTLDSLVGYTVPLIAHDYAAKTPVMWNRLYEKKNINIRNLMLVANPKKTKEILETLKEDPKYLGGGAGVGFKESTIKFLDKLEPENIKAVNIIVKKNNLLVGHNTDSEGLMLSLEEKLKLIDKTVKDDNFVIIGAGGVSQQFARTLINRGAKYLAIVNRTFSKAVSLAETLNKEYKKSVAIGVGENMTRGVLLNSENPPAAIINLSDKGSDILPSTTMFYSTGTSNEHLSREMVNQAKKLRPELIYADIVLPKNGRSISLRVVDAAGIDEKYTLDGKPMVVYQAIPAYKMIEETYEDIHKTTSKKEILEIFKKASGII